MTREDIAPKLIAYFKTLGLIGAGFLLGCAYTGFIVGLGQIG